MRHRLLASMEAYFKKTGGTSVYDREHYCEVSREAEVYLVPDSVLFESVEEEVIAAVRVVVVQEGDSEPQRVRNEDEEVAERPRQPPLSHTPEPWPPSGMRCAARVGGKPRASESRSLISRRYALKRQSFFTATRCRRGVDAPR